MKIPVIAAAVLVALAACAAPRNFPPGATVEDRAVDFVTNLAAGNYAFAAGQFNRKLKFLIPPVQLRVVYRMQTIQYGEFRSIEATRTTNVKEFTGVTLTCAFRNALLDIRVVYDTNNQVAGLWFAPARHFGHYVVPAYVNTNAFVETDVRFGTTNWPLPGSLSLPKRQAPFPVVIILHGSGPIDRDGAVGMQKPYRDIAWGLASRGIAVLRYDKRTFAYGGSLSQKDIPTLWEEAVEDAVEAVKFASEIPGADTNRIYVIGHSLGVTSALRLHEQDVPVRGYVLMAGTLRPMEDLVLEQTVYLATNDGDYTFNEKLQVAATRRMVRNASEGNVRENTPASRLPLGVVASYWIDLHREADLGDLGNRTPVLVLQGERDYQVTMRDYGLWTDRLAGRSNAEFRSYPGLNHLFSSGSGLSTPEEYMHENHIDPAVIDDIAKFIGESR